MQATVREHPQKKGRKAVRKVPAILVKYESRPGFRVPIPAEVVGPAIERLKTRNGGHVAPQEVVDAARPERSPLHAAFTWDDSIAAEKCRQDEARRLIRSYYVVEVKDGQEQPPCIANVRVILPETGSVYVSSARAMSDVDLREQVLAEIRGFIKGMQSRYRHMPGVRELMLQAIDELAAE